MEPLLRQGGAVTRQLELKEWHMDPLTFTSADGSRELVPDGALMLVDEANKEEYCQLLCEDFLVGGLREELGCLVMGFHELIPQELLRARDLDAERLRLLVCGVTAERLDVDEWEQNSLIEGQQEVAHWFFDWLRSKDPEVRGRLLAFATGSSVLPCGWEGLRDPQGRPLPFRVAVQGRKESLPFARTCANLIVLPKVESREELERKLDTVLEFAGREMLLL